MTNNSVYYIKARIYLVHDWLIRAGDLVSADQFVYAFSQHAPPIGWHLWHIARFADRLQAKLAELAKNSPAVEIWYRDNVSADWNVSPDKLGVFESGMGQAHEQAQVTIVQAGKIAVIDYAKTVFETCTMTIDKLSDSDFEKTYYGILDYGYDGATGKVWATEPKASTVAQDLIFHASHGSRHMGMMEALRGLLGTAGTLSV